MKPLGLLFATLIVFLANPVFAEAQADQVYMSPLITVIDDDPDRGADDTEIGGQLGIGKVLNDRWNVEVMIQAADFSGLNPQQHLGVGVDFQAIFRRSARLSPYLFLGVGALDIDLDTGGDDVGVMYSVGAGFLIDLGTSPVALRGEYRYRSDTSARSTLSDNLFSLGLQVPLGSAKLKIIDTDGDGVPDASDRCPDTALGTIVGIYGCELDSDGDRVKDSADKCPNTPRGIAVDLAGCPKDGDDDGVGDDRDQCPGTVAGATVDATGCELDSDLDGIVNRVDDCPDSAPGVQVDVKGCEIKGEIHLPGVNFATNSNELLPGAEHVLDNAAGSLRKNPSIRVEVQGHTDSAGAAVYNQSLSERRANTVLNYLVTSGISVDRLSARGYGEAKPIADNSTAQGKAANRRVVLSIVAR